jgi:hypothetical protein
MLFSSFLSPPYPRVFCNLRAIPPRPEMLRQKGESQAFARRRNAAMVKVCNRLEGAFADWLGDRLIMSD